MKYEVGQIEAKWQKYWKNNPIAKARKAGNGKKYYCLDMFPYPSGSGLHVGHWRGYVLSDLYARMKWLEGYNVLHPMGWDAFGLPAENAAIKLGIHPRESTEKNIAVFKRQLEQLAAIYDWDKEVDTTDPHYYKWTQWIFLQMYKAGLAYEDFMPINWCPSCLTGLANEEVVNGKCDRCGTAVEERTIRQWVLRITQYAQKLLDGLDTLEWSEKIKLMQRNWIGRSEGLVFTAPVADAELLDIESPIWVWSGLTIQTFSAHFEAFCADTFVVIAPDHPFLPTLLEDVPNKDEIVAFCKKLVDKRIERGFEEEKESEGIFTGRYIVDPVGNGYLPIWVASFALAQYGTGLVKCSAHDTRDFAFAKKYNIPLKVVLLPEDPELRERVKKFEICYTDMQNGILAEPTPFAGKKAGDVREAIIEYCEQKGYAQRKTSYRLRDWVFSRQRYWGEPIPLIHCKNCGVVPVPEDQLPITLPDVERYQPTGTGESPLAAISEWVNTTCPQCGDAAKRETNTMPQWAGSCWYFLRYPNPNLSDKPWDPEDMKYWLPVDLYVGGIEHAILHLLYARFYVKVLYDLRLLPFDEPFSHLFNQGMVLKYSEKSGLVEKMSKSQGNVVNPDDIVHTYGSDALRMYIMFMGPPELDCEWQDTGLEGIKRFLNKVWNFATNTETILSSNEQEEMAVIKRVHKFVYDFQERMRVFKPNTAISAAMELFNDIQADSMHLSKESLEKVLVSLSIFAPHMTSELLETILGKQLHECSWPAYDESLLVQDTITYVVQVNGKVRANLTMPVSADQKTVEQEAAQQITKWLEGKEVVKTIFVHGRLVSFVVR